MEFFVSLYIHYVFGVSLFLFFVLFYYGCVDDVVLWMYIHLIMENRIPQKVRRMGHEPTVCVAFVFIKPILGNRYGPGVIP